MLADKPLTDDYQGSVQPSPDIIYGNPVLRPRNADGWRGVARCVVREFGRLLPAPQSAWPSFSPRTRGRYRKDDSFEIKQTATTATVPDERRARRRSYRPSTRKGKKGVLVFVTPAMAKQLRQLALDEDSTVQALGHQALENLLVQRGRVARQEQ